MDTGMRVVGPEKSRRVLHWTVAAAFLVLFVTGLIIFVPAFSGVASGGWTRVLHRASAAVLVAAPVIYALFNASSAREWLSGLAFWKKRVAYPHNRSNRWKDTHKILISIGFVFIVVTGIIQWFFKGILPGEAFQWSLSIHDVFFFGAGLVLLSHVYFELDWWLWKRKHCRTCDLVYCAEVCPTRAMVRAPDGVVEYQPRNCNNCRQCLESCRDKSYYKIVPERVQDEARETPEHSESVVT